MRKDIYFKLSTTFININNIINISKMATEAFKDTMIELHKDYLEFAKEVKHEDVKLSFKEYVELYIGYLPSYNNLMVFDEEELPELEVEPTEESVG